MTVPLVLVMAAQFAVNRYVPTIYWLAVVLVSIVGTLITENLHIPLEVTTIVLTVALIAVFVMWYLVEGTLSIHSVVTLRREAFYWLAILCTFGLGTAAGDLAAEKFGLGYLASALLVGAIICAVAALHCGVNLNGVLAFWIAYILTRPLGASLGDLLSQDRDAGGLQLGPITTSLLFGTTIVALVAHPSRSKVDQIPTAATEPPVEDREALETSGLQPPH
jgi:uncharacterized membrane-anchored protein